MMILFVIYSGHSKKCNIYILKKLILFHFLTVKDSGYHIISFPLFFFRNSSNAVISRNFHSETLMKMKLLPYIKMHYIFFLE